MKFYLKSNRTIQIIVYKHPAQQASNSEIDYIIKIEWPFFCNTHERAFIQRSQRTTSNQYLSTKINVCHYEIICYASTSL